MCGYNCSGQCEKTKIRIKKKKETGGLKKVKNWKAPEVLVRSGRRRGGEGGWGRHSCNNSLAV